MPEIGLTHYLVVSAVLFALGMIGGGAIGGLLAGGALSNLGNTISSSLAGAGDTLAQATLSSGNAVADATRWSGQTQAGPAKVLISEGFDAARRFLPGG